MLKNNFWQIWTLNPKIVREKKPICCILTSKTKFLTNLYLQTNILSNFDMKNQILTSKTKFLTNFWH